MLRAHDASEQATIGFTEYDGKMVFVNLLGGLNEKEFGRTLVELAEEHLPGEVYLDFARADFELQSSEWSTGHGEGYRARLRESGRSALLEWIETVARPQAEEFIRNFEWKATARRSRKRGKHEPWKRPKGR